MAKQGENFVLNGYGHYRRADGTLMINLPSHAHPSPLLDPKSNAGVVGLGYYLVSVGDAYMIGAALIPVGFLVAGVGGFLAITSPASGPMMVFPAGVGLALFVIGAYTVGMGANAISQGVYNQTGMNFGKVPGVVTPFPNERTPGGFVPYNK